MHFDVPSDRPQTSAQNAGPWYRELNRYHWFVLFVASLGWMFDTMDQQLFNLARVPAMAGVAQTCRMSTSKSTPGSSSATRAQAGRGGLREKTPELVRRCRDRHLSDRLGARRSGVWRAGRSYRPGADHADHDLDLPAFHGLSCPSRRILGTSRFSGS